MAPSRCMTLDDFSYQPANRVSFSLSCTVWDVRKGSFQRLCEMLRILLGDLLPIGRIVAAVVTLAIELEVVRVRRICAGRFPAVPLRHVQQR